MKLDLGDDEPFAAGSNIDFWYSMRDHLSLAFSEDLYNEAFDRLQGDLMDSISRGYSGSLERCMIELVCL